MFHATPSYNHRQSCSIQYLGGKRKTPSSLGPLSWFNLLYGRLKSTQVSPTQRLSGGCYLIPFPCRASGSYSSPRSPCATVFDHLYIISPRGWGLTTENWFRLQKKRKGFDFIPLLSCISWWWMINRNIMNIVVPKWSKMYQSQCNRSWLTDPQHDHQRKVGGHRQLNGADAPQTSSDLRRHRYPSKNIRAAAQHVP